MSDKFQGKYRNESARLKNWDYASNGAYFITICTDNREHYFGEIENGKMQVSPAGAIAYVLWQEIKNHAKNIALGEFIVMPNHVHGILIINGNVGHGRAVACNGPDGNAYVQAGGDVALGFDRDVACNVPTDNPDRDGDENRTDVACNVPTNEDSEKNQEMAAISPKPNSVSTIIRSYKSAVTNYCNRLGLKFAWQPRFHDHIIRNDEAFQNISAYIKNNPSNWKEDKFS
jgi:REP element-mobilizing transposase RayT